MDHLCYFCLVLLSSYERLFVDVLWSPAGKELTSWLLFVMSNRDICHIPIGTLGQVWCLIVLIPDLCIFLTLLSILSLFCNEFKKFNNTRTRMLHSVYFMKLKLF